MPSSLHAHWWSTAVLYMPTDDLLLFSACPLVIYCCSLHVHWHLTFPTEALGTFYNSSGRVSDMFDNINFCSRKGTGGIELSYCRQCPGGSYVPCTEFRHSLLCALCMCLVALNGHLVPACPAGWFTHAVPGDTYIQECPATDKFRTVSPTPNYRYFSFFTNKFWSETL